MLLLLKVQAAASNLRAYRKGQRVLIFNQQGRSEAVDLLTRLFTALKSHNSPAFDHVVFCTNVTYAENGYNKGLPTYPTNTANLLTAAQILSTTHITLLQSLGLLSRKLLQKSGGLLIPKLVLRSCQPFKRHLSMLGHCLPEMSMKEISKCTSL